MKGLANQIAIYAACERYFGRPRFAWLRSIPNGVRSWLDGFDALARDEKDCGCKRLGGGGAFYCSGAHLVASLKADD